MHTQFWSENLKGRDDAEDLGVDGRIILEQILYGNGGGGVNWIFVAQEGDQRRALVNTVMNLRVP
jgi:hypothetical protein